MIEIRDFLFKYETVVINLIFHFLLENVLQFDYWHGRAVLGATAPLLSRVPQI